MATISVNLPSRSKDTEFLPLSVFRPPLEMLFFAEFGARLGRHGRKPPSGEISLLVLGGGDLGGFGRFGSTFSVKFS